MNNTKGFSCNCRSSAHVGCFCKLSNQKIHWLGDILCQSPEQVGLKASQKLEQESFCRMFRALSSSLNWGARLRCQVVHHTGVCYQHWGWTCWYWAVNCYWPNWNSYQNLIKAGSPSQCLTSPGWAAWTSLHSASMKVMYKLSGKFLHLSQCCAHPELEWGS